ncbi:hypothetical protein [Burkholderia territorii]|uniref:hypothetical protein n=1 Tax=Burkholderia territorii TaxID=1503055 RepID=UPI000AAE0088|nr:hypothetical protein [Burkholderia territorii]
MKRATKNMPALIAPDALHILAAMQSGRTYEPARLADNLRMPTAIVRVQLKQLEQAGKVECAMFRNDYGGYRSRVYRIDEGVPLSRHDAAQRVAEVHAGDVVNAMKPGVGYREREISAHHSITIHQTRLLLSTLVQDARVVKLAAGSVKRNSHVYYVAGTEPGTKAAVSSRSAVVQPLADRPVYVPDHAYSLQSLRELSKAGRGRS